MNADEQDSSSSQAALACYDRLMSHFICVDYSGRAQIEIKGSDHRQVVQNLCTNDVQRLQPGSGCEAFVTSVQGKCLGFVSIFVGDDVTVLETVAGESESLVKHIDRYIITEDAEVTDRSQAWAELLVAGPDSWQVIQRLDPRVGDQLGQEPRPFMHGSLAVAGCQGWFRSVNWLSVPSVLIACDEQDKPQFAQAIQALDDHHECHDSAGHLAIDMARIEAGYPEFGRDITEKNLPQEVARNKEAISFTKGCYLGQETVARLDALGHVNRTLALIAMETSITVPAGTPIVVDDATVGEVTSSAYSPQRKTTLVMGYLRVPCDQAGQAVRVLGTAGQVVTRPTS